MPRIKACIASRSKSLFKATIASIKARNLKKQQNKEERQKLRTTEILEYFVKGTTKYCHHLHVGSSLFHLLINNNLTAERIHHKNYNNTDYQIGTEWEEHIENLSSLPLLNGKEVKFKVQFKDPFRISEACRILCAKPDYQIEYRNDFGLKVEALLEVKSANRDINLRAFHQGNYDQQAMQLQIALHCFSISHGFLVFVRGDKTNCKESENIGYKIIRIDRDEKFLSDRKEMILDGFANYVATIACYPEQASENMKKYVCDKVYSIQNYIFCGTESRFRMERPMRQAPTQSKSKLCQINKMFIKLRNKELGRRKKVGRPRLRNRELVKPRYSTAIEYKEVLGNLF